MSNKSESYKNQGPYQAYLENIPPNAPEPTRNNRDELIIVSGELRCRMHKCLNRKLFHDASGLRQHYKGVHDETLEEQAIGKPKGDHNYNVHMFYARLMAGEPLEPIPRKPRHRGLTPPPTDPSAGAGTGHNA